MMYISKGMISKPSDSDNAHVSRCGREYRLRGDMARLWLAGRFCASSGGSAPHPGLCRLEAMGLIEIAEQDAAAKYRLLTNCVICLVNPAAHGFLLDKNERLIWTWIKNAGFKLTISELVYLSDRGIRPAPSFFGRDNWHTLIHAIYTRETIFGRVLETEMEHAGRRDKTVLAVLGLLRKKRIVLV